MPETSDPPVAALLRQDTDLPNLSATVAPHAPATPGRTLIQVNGADLPFASARDPQRLSNAQGQCVDQGDQGRAKEDV